MVGVDENKRNFTDWNSGVSSQWSWAELLSRTLKKVSNLLQPRVRNSGRIKAKFTIVN